MSLTLIINFFICKCRVKYQDFKLILFRLVDCPGKQVFLRYLFDFRVKIFVSGALLIRMNIKSMILWMATNLGRWSVRHVRTVRHFYTHWNYGKNILFIHWHSLAFSYFEKQNSLDFLLIWHVWILNLSI